MTLKECKEFVEKIKPHAFDEDTVTEWINEVDGYVQSEIMLLNTPLNLTRYNWEEHKDTELMVKPPHDKIYRDYLEAKIDYSNGEYNKAENSFAMYNEHILEFTVWFIEMYHPADGGVKCGA